MSPGSLRLYQVASGTADANGNVSLVFNGPGSGRVWQGGISIVSGTVGTLFTLTIGGQPWGAINSPGPGGPYQVWSGQDIELSATKVKPGQSFVAVMSGVDDPENGVTPYTGPIAVSSVSTGSP